MREADHEGGREVIWEVTREGGHENVGGKFPSRIASPESPYRQLTVYKFGVLQPR